MEPRLTSMTNTEKPRLVASSVRQRSEMSAWYGLKYTWAVNVHTTTLSSRISLPNTAHRRRQRHWRPCHNRNSSGPIGNISW